MNQADIKIFSDPQFLSVAAVKALIKLVQDNVTLHGICTLALAGGLTPLATYALLASQPYRDQIDWPLVHIFWGDERCVPPDHSDSNYFKAYQTLLKHVPLPEGNIHRVRAELEPHQAARLYEEELRAFFPALAEDGGVGQTGFDVTILGLGDDGHTASLFPGAAAVREQTRWTEAYYVGHLAAWRITLTPALLNRSAHVRFLVAGEAKRDTLQRVIYGTYQPDRYPAQVIRLLDGSVVWMVDEAAASYL